MRAGEPLNPMRILMTADAIGGVWTYARDLAAGLEAEGAAVTLAVIGPPPTPHQLKDLKGAAPHVELVQLDDRPDWLAGSAAEVMATGRKLAEFVARLKADVLHLNAPAFASGATFPCPVLAVTHSCVATWHRAVRGGPLPKDFLWRRDLVAEGFARADALVAPSHAFADATAREYGLYRRINVVHNGRDFPCAPAACSRALVFSAGRLWDEGKNFATLELAARGIDAPLEAAGALEGPEGSLARFSAIRALGELSALEMAARLAERPIFASAALYEPFGLAVLEAAKAGCPLVLSDIPTFRELWGGVAVLVPPRADSAFARALNELIASPERRLAIGEQARLRAESYDSARMAAAYGGLYRRLTERKTPGRKEAAA